jgi:thioredoxin reductase (NADPH)
MANHHQLIIIGSGPAGFTAGIYAARADLAPLIFEGIQPGGQLTITTDVENFPGFPDGIMGPDLMDAMRKQAHRFGSKSIYEMVKEVDLSKRPFTLKIDNETFTCDALIVATGASANTGKLPNEAELMGHGLSACATCDGFFFRGKDVVVVGGGDSAMEEAHFLTKFANKVTIVHRRDEFRASKAMQHRVLNNPKIEVIWNSSVVELIGTKETGLTAVTLEGNDGTRRNFETQGLFYAIGHKPNTNLFKDVLDMDETGYLRVQAGTSKTNVEGVFAAGDVADSHYRQAITSAGSGCMAAMDAEHFLGVDTSVNTYAPNPVAAE